jgi:membrane protease YdiL (CAAX protease family)
MTDQRTIPLRPLILGLLTLLVVLRISTSLIASFTEPQIASRLQLYQTDLMLNATELARPTPDNGAPVPSVLFGSDPFNNALRQYTDVRETAETTLATLNARLQTFTPTPDQPNPPPAIQRAIQQQRPLLDQLDLRIGVLQAHQNQPDDARDRWQQVRDRTLPDPSADAKVVSKTADVLLGLWNQPPRILPDAEAILNTHLDGWFRYQALSRLYQLQQRQDALLALQTTQQAIAQSTVGKLAVVSLFPVVGSIIGVILLIVLIGQRAVKGSAAALAQNGTVAWETPWTWDVIWQVLVVGFFLIGQLVIPLLLNFFSVNFAAYGIRARAVYSLTYYLSMTALGLLVLYLSIRPYFPLPKDWFRVRLSDRWWAWGTGSYFVALPLMILVSFVNQQIWQGRGGSNPLLQIVLEEGDPVSLGIFFFTAAIAAPVFEELLFRGFLLASLTRYLPVGGAIALSGVIFAVAHMSLSEVLPLTLLGCILGFVYTRSRNLLTPMLLHSLWNGATMLSLFVLGSH